MDTEPTLSTRIYDRLIQMDTEPTLSTRMNTPETDESLRTDIMTEEDEGAIPDILSWFPKLEAVFGDPLAKLAVKDVVIPSLAFPRLFSIHRTIQDDLDEEYLDDFESCISPPHILIIHDQQSNLEYESFCCKPEALQKLPPKASSVSVLDLDSRISDLQLKGIPYAVVFCLDLDGSQFKRNVMTENKYCHFNQILERNMMDFVEKHKPRYAFNVQNEELCSYLEEHTKIEIASDLIRSMLQKESTNLDKRVFHLGHARCLPDSISRDFEENVIANSRKTLQKIERNDEISIHDVKSTVKLREAIPCVYSSYPRFIVNDGLPEKQVAKNKMETLRSNLDVIENELKDIIPLDVQFCCRRCSMICEIAVIKNCLKIMVSAETLSDKKAKDDLLAMVKRHSGEFTINQDSFELSSDSMVPMASPGSGIHTNTVYGTLTCYGRIENVHESLNVGITNDHIARPWHAIYDEEENQIGKSTGAYNIEPSDFHYGGILDFAAFELTSDEHIVRLYNSFDPLNVQLDITIYNGPLNQILQRELFMLSANSPNRKEVEYLGTIQKANGRTIHLVRNKGPVLFQEGDSGSLVGYTNASGAINAVFLFIGKIGNDGYCCTFFECWRYLKDYRHADLKLL